MSIMENAARLAWDAQAKEDRRRHKAMERVKGEVTVVANRVFGYTSHDDPERISRSEITVMGMGADLRSLGWFVRDGMKFCGGEVWDDYWTSALFMALHDRAEPSRRYHELKDSKDWVQVRNLIQVYDTAQRMTRRIELRCTGRCPSGAFEDNGCRHEWHVDMPKTHLWDKFWCPGCNQNTYVDVRSAEPRIEVPNPPAR